jgi:hypothetical protein
MDVAKLMASDAVFYYGVVIGSRACPECGAAPGELCVIRRGELAGCRWTTEEMIWPHGARKVALHEVVAREPEPKTGTGENFDLFAA